MSDFLEEVKPYLRVDGDYDDGVIVPLIRAAQAKLTGSGVNKPNEDADEDTKYLYELAVKMLVSHWYENREQEIGGRTQHVITMGVQTIILQLKAGGLVENSKSE